jgi:hypothetical protein
VHVDLAAITSNTVKRLSSHGLWLGIWYVLLGLLEDRHTQEGFLIKALDAGFGMGSLHDA